MVKYKNENRWVNLNNLPTFKFGNEERIDWSKSVGCIIPFQYDKVNSYMQIVGYRKQDTDTNRHRAILTIFIDKYTSEPVEVRSDFITHCNLHNLVGNRIINYAPHLIKYLEDPDDAYKYTYESNQKVWMICPICGHRHFKNIGNVYKYGFVCDCTSDGISIPNKIMFNILQQLNVSFINEVNKSYGYDWMKNYSYDFLFNINGNPIIVEMDGFFHQFQQETDKIKTNLAKDNKIKLIRIDCIYNNIDPIDFIKSNILNSELSTLLPLDKVDWDVCRNFATNSLLLETCDLWERDLLGISQIAQKLCLDRHTIRRYLQRGFKINKCPTYNIEEARRRGVIDKLLPIANTSNGEIKHVFQSANELVEKSIEYFGIQCTRKGVQSVCNNEYKSHHGLQFKYITKEQYEQYKMILDNIGVVKGGIK